MLRRPIFPQTQIRAGLFIIFFFFFVGFWDWAGVLDTLNSVLLYMLHLIYVHSDKGHDYRD